MPKIIHFNSDTKEMMDFISKLTEYIQTENVDNIMIAFKKKDGEISTGFCNMDFGQRAELIGHMQVDLIDSMIQQNYVWG